MSDHRLKSCPFCGGPAEIEVEEWLSWLFGRSWRCICQVCRTHRGYRDTEAAAIAAWNHRTIATTLILLLCACALAQQPPGAPTNLRVATASVDSNIVYLTVTAGTNNPMQLPFEGWSAWWMPEPNYPATNFGGVWLSNVWLPEASLDGINWNLPINHAAFVGTRAQRISGQIAPMWNYTEVGSNWMVRIRRLAPQKIQ